MASGNGGAFCPYGTEVQTGSPCSGLIEIGAAAALAVIFPVAIPAEIAAIVAGLDFGYMAVQDLCSFTPNDPGPFKLEWLSPWNVAYDVGLIEAWLGEELLLYAWNHCCQCKTPPNAGYQVYMAVNSGPVASGRYIYLDPALPAGAYGFYLEGQWAASAGTQAGKCYGAWPNYTNLGTATSCNNPTGGVGLDGACGVFAGPACGGGQTFGQFQSCVASATVQNFGQAQCLRIHVQGGDASNQAIFTGRLFYQINGPQVLPGSAIPPSNVRTGPSGVTTTTPTLPAPTTEGVACNFAPIAANTMERIIAPRDRVADGGTHAISGAGSLPIAASAVGATITITAHPTEYDHDAGDPPRVFHAGWVAPSADGVEMVTPQLPIGAIEMEIWGFKPIDHFLVYNLVPGWSASVQFWNTSTPL